MIIIINTNMLLQDILWLSLHSWQYESCLVQMKPLVNCWLHLSSAIYKDIQLCND